MSATAYQYMLETACKEGTTQGDPTAVPMFAIDITPLLPTIVSSADAQEKLKHVSFADDLDGGKIVDPTDSIIEHDNIFCCSGLLNNRIFNKT